MKTPDIRIVGTHKPIYEVYVDGTPVATCATYDKACAIAKTYKNKSKKRSS